MQWTDEAILLTVKNFSEKKLRLTVLTQSKGSQSGLITGPHNVKKNHIHYAVGDRLHITWQARLEQHLGMFKIERTATTAPLLFGQKEKIFILQALCDWMSFLPENHPYPIIFMRLKTILQHLLTCTAEEAFLAFCLFEKQLLDDLGFGFDIARCCVSQQAENLTYVSPKTARAVSQNAAGSYANRLLPLPGFWLNQHHCFSWVEIAQSFQTTQFFFQKYIFQPYHTFSTARNYLVALAQQNAAMNRQLG